MLSDDAEKLNFSSGNSELINAEQLVGVSDYTVEGTDARAADYDASNSFNTYLQKIGEYPILPDEEQRELGRAIQAGHRARAQLDELTGQSSEDLERVMHAGKAARQKLVLNCLAFAIYLAKPWQGNGLEFDDLVQVANTALIASAEKWDPDYATSESAPDMSLIEHENMPTYKFTTYAGTAIKRRLADTVAQTANTIYVPPATHGFIRRYDLLFEKHIAEHGVPPTQDELIELYGYTHERLKTIHAGKIALLPMLELVTDSSARILPEEYEGEDRGVMADRSSGEISVNEVDPVFGEVTLLSLRSALEYVLGDYVQANSGRKGSESARARKIALLKALYGVGADEQPLDELSTKYGIKPRSVIKMKSALLAELRKSVRTQPLREFLD